MARGAEAKLRRRNRKQADDDAVTDMFGTEGGDDFPPAAAAAAAAKHSSGGAVVEDDASDDGDDHDVNLPKKKSVNKGNKAAAALPAATAPNGGGAGGIKRTPLILLIMMVGTTLLPALIYAGDYASSFLAKNNIAGGIGFRLGIGAVPKKRVLSFYEKHAPEKLNDVPTILAKHYGEYPQLIKKLERKYQDYGYFMGWEQDEAPLRIAMEHMQGVYDTWIQQYWNRYAPQILKTAFRNIRYNLTFLYKRGGKIWKKHAWPLLEPIFGVPDGAEAQKRKDAAAARDKKRGAGKKTGARRKNTGYRDDVDED